MNSGPLTLLDGQTALVTGTGGGIGRAIALRFAEEGAAVAVHFRTAVDAAGDVAARIRESGSEAVVLRAGLTDEEARGRLVREGTDRSGGRLRALVDNAAVRPVQPLPGMTAAEWRTVVDTDLTSVFACTQAAAAHMRGHGGARTAALECGPDGIRVNAESPGRIDGEGPVEARPDGVRRVPGLAVRALDHRPPPDRRRRHPGPADMVSA
ncbi:3-oxoacyl-[acyl-carrier protein] reductase [Streptomyces puniciscabiei]|uniref:3-oxoacyl-[acyl-carrier protein] reductase n=1 Tax=Streptomyces puniciscabiei TaxID=164348 RepID=A0A542UFX9_9ACTN|nr:3-oxoacyl-[acyl-carrier protein] reductase [Streptomyces puniciscabiei]